MKRVATTPDKFHKYSPRGTTRRTQNLAQSFHHCITTFFSKSTLINYVPCEKLWPWDGPNMPSRSWNTHKPCCWLRKVNPQGGRWYSMWYPRYWIAEHSVFHTSEREKTFSKRRAMVLPFQYQARRIVGPAIGQGKTAFSQVTVYMAFIGSRKVTEFLFYKNLVGTLGHKFSLFAQYGTHLPLTAT